MQHSAKTPGFPTNGPADHFARVVEVCEADLRFWKTKLGTLNPSNAARSKKKLKRFTKESSLEQKSKAALRLRICPLVQRSANNSGFPANGTADHEFLKAKMETLNFWIAARFDQN